MEFDLSSWGSRALENLEKGLDKAMGFEEEKGVVEELNTTEERKVRVEESERIQFLEKAKEDLSNALQKLREKHKMLRSESSKTIKELNDRLVQLQKSKDKDDATEMLLKAKDDQIAAVTEEGQVLAEKQAKMEMSLKTLRTQAKEREKALRTTQQQLETEKKKNIELEKVMGSQRKALEEFELKVRELEMGQKRYLEQMEQPKVNVDTESQLRLTIKQLRQQFDSVSAEFRRKEESLVEEVEETRKKYQDAEQRCEILIAGVPEATKPLLRQINALKQNIISQQEHFTSFELKMKREMKRAVDEANAEKDKVIHQRDEMQSEREMILQREKRIAVELDKMKSLVKARDDEVSRLSSKIQELLVSVRQKDETNALHIRNLEEKLNQKDLIISTLKLQTEHSSVTPKPVEQVPVQRSPLISVSPRDLSGMALSESTKALVRHRDGQIVYLNTQLKSLEERNSCLEDQLVLLRGQTREMHVLQERIASLEKSNTKLLQRYETSLEMIGTTEERYQEALADLSDVKEMYKSQIIELLGRIEQLQPF